MSTPPRDTVLLEELCWPDVRDALARGVDTIIVPTGSTEQHGPHLPLLTDHLEARVLGERVARDLGNALSAPVVSVGCSRHHLHFPGSISLSTPTFVQVLADYCRSLAPQGFSKFVLLSFHGGNFEALNEAVTIVRAELPEIKVIAYSDIGRFIEVMHRVADRDGIDRLASGSHAGENETSIVMSLRPELVRMDRYEPGFMGDFSHLREQLHREGMQAVSRNGIIGDPKPATPRRGEAYMSALAGAIVEWARTELA